MSELALRRIVPENPASGVEVAGFLAKTTTVTEDYTITSDISTVNVNAASATITLPLATLVGRRVTVRKISASAGTVTISRAGADTIGVSSIAKVLKAQFGSATFEVVASGSWSMVHRYEKGTWTPGQGAGLVVTGAFSSIGGYTLDGDIVYLSGRISAATSIQTSAGAQFVTGLPYAIVEGAALGSFINGGVTQSGGLGVFSLVMFSDTSITDENFDFAATHTTDA